MKKILSLVLTMSLVISALCLCVSAAGEPVTIGSTGYASLADALLAVKDGETIKLNADMTVETAVIFTPETAIKFTIDGNGKKVTANVPKGDNHDGFLKLGNCTVAINNLKIDYTESTKSVANGKMGCAAIVAVAGADVTLTNVEVVAFYGDGLHIADAGKMTIKSGSYVIDPSNEAPQSNLICTDKAATLVIDGGKFARDGIGGANKRAILRLNGAGCDVTINGGEFSSIVGRIVNLNGSVTPSDTVANRKVVINGGKFVCGAADGSHDPVININANGADIVINGGDFTTYASCAMIADYSSRKDATLVINGGKFTGTAADVAAVKAVVPAGITVKEADTVIEVNPKAEPETPSTPDTPATPDTPSTPDTPDKPTPATGDAVVALAVVAAVALFGTAVIIRKKVND